MVTANAIAKQLNEIRDINLESLQEERVLAHKFGQTSVYAAAIPLGTIITVGKMVLDLISILKGDPDLDAVKSQVEQISAKLVEIQMLLAQVVSLLKEIYEYIEEQAQKAASDSVLSQITAIDLLFAHQLRGNRTISPDQQSKLSYEVLFPFSTNIGILMRSGFLYYNTVAAACLYESALLRAVSAEREAVRSRAAQYSHYFEMAGDSGVSGSLASRRQQIEKDMESDIATDGRRPRPLGEIVTHKVENYQELALVRLYDYSIQEGVKRVSEGWVVTNSHAHPNREKYPRFMTGRIITGQFTASGSPPDRLPATTVTLAQLTDDHNAFAAKASKAKMLGEAASASLRYRDVMKDVT